MPAMRSLRVSLSVGLLLVANALAQTPAPRPVEPVPTGRHLRWQRLGLYMFVHFNMNTFTDVEWGDGRETPDRFAPTALDCEQWARVAVAAGMKGIILTAKHHDGFCLWPTQTTEHHVGNSAWRDGKGDVLAELSAACKKHGLLMGLYLSPWDRNHPDYGESERYNAVFRQQLEEILTRYGDVFEVWFDGACGEGPTGKRQVYDWPSFVAKVREHQPRAVIFSDAGPDIRWVGNERGFADATNWAPMERDRFVPGDPKYAELTSGHRDGTHWVPAECDVSIRPGWYYHPSQDDQVKSVEHLLDIWYGSVGSNANLLLNIPVDRRGLVHENDEARLVEWAAVLEATFAHDLARAARASADAFRGESREFAPRHVNDDDPSTYWATDDQHSSGAVILEFDAPTRFDRVWLEEYVPLGQRVEEFVVEARTDGDWTEVGRGTTIGFRRILRLPSTVADAVRIRILRAKACPTLSRVSLYASPPAVVVASRAQEFYGSTWIEARASSPDAAVHFTLDGSEPDAASPIAQGTLVLSRSAVLKARAILDEVAGPVVERRFRAVGPADLRPRDGAAGSVRGLRYRYYEGGWQALSDLPNREPVEAGVVEGLSRAPLRRDEHVALVYEGWVTVPRDGLWRFRLTSDDGSRLWIGDDLVVDNDGLHGMVAKTGAVALAAGAHPLRLGWFNAKGGSGLELEWSSDGEAWQAVPADALTR